MLPGVTASAQADLPIDPATVTIRLDRSACYGSCPDYSVTIEGDGRVVFVSTDRPVDPVSQVHRQFSRSDGVLLGGHHEIRIPPEEVAALAARFVAADFGALDDEYVARITDSPTYVLTFTHAGTTKRVVDYVGREVGMPAIVSELERAVDETAHTAMWVSGNAMSVDWLRVGGFDFASAQAGEILLQGAVRDADEDFLLGMVDAGVDLARRASLGRERPVLGKALLEAALHNGQPRLFEHLRSMGWLDRLGADRAATAFAERAGGCNPAMPAALAAAGVAIDAPAAEGYGYGSDGDTALLALTTSWLCRDETARVETARQLLALGADPNHRNAAGESAIFSVENPELLALLYANGADPTVIDHNGDSAVFSSWTDAIVLQHLQAGAPLHGHYYDGRGLREQMQHRPMPLSEAWLDAHGL
ncbi:MAG: hypothetical protein KDE15_04000 [Erythrobacter sp.]|nr:hypothetical protein [Erythrobacter sp.]